MPATKQEYNLFKRLIGDFGVNKVSNHELDQYLDDATNEVTVDFVTVKTTAPVMDSPEFNQFENFTIVKPKPLTKFQDLHVQFHTEVIYKAAINWWWNVASQHAARLTTQVGVAAQQADQLYQRSMMMIESLEERYEKIQQLGMHITIGNISYFHKRYLQRVGGQREENALVEGEGAQPGDLWYG